ncbi:restriction endonuclease subunit S [Phaeobacter inhibens]|uniref:restriction endonuclease subunit S n=1 Tax=Phaeobacter inhibens TaxID=221822 RepID=UPI002490551B|nr:restriction endonuclease subunit S [Phaeobacter inhibens]
MSSARVRELRFPGFEEEWITEKLGQFMSFKNGVNAGKEAYGRGRKFVNVMDIIRKGPITHSNIIGRVEISDAEFEKNEVKYGDILFQRSSETREEVGQSNVYLDRDRSATFGGFVIRGRPTRSFDPKFFDTLLRTATVRKDLTSRSGGSTRYNVGQESLSHVLITVPVDEAEQQKIASFFDTVSCKITLLTEKKAALEAYKRGVIQRLFSRALRFTRDDGSAFPDWEERKLGDLFDWIKTNNLSRSNLTDEPESGIQNIHYGDIHGKFSAIFRQSCEHVPFIEVNAIPKIKDEEYVRVGDVVIADASEDYADIGKSIEVLEVNEKSLVAGLHTFIARPKRSEVSLGFPGYLLRSEDMRQQIVRIAQGISVLGISKGKLEKITFELPHPDEQRKIADFLSSIDAKITAVSAQISEMETFKKGLLQKMFL